MLAWPAVVQISSMQVQALAGAVERAGVERARFFEAAGLDAALLDDMHARIPLEQYQHLVRTAYQLSGDPAFGLHMGERMALGSFDVIGHLVEQSATMREAIEMTLRYSRIVSPEPRLSFEEESDYATLCLLLPEEDGLEVLLAAEFAMIALWRMLRAFVEDDALPRRAFFRHAAPAHRADYARFFGGKERFGHAFTGLQFDRAWLDRAPQRRQNELRDYLLTRAEALLAKADRDLSTAERVRCWLAARTDLGPPTLEVVARDLGVSTRSLRRRLQSEGAQFSVLVDEARAARAKSLLEARAHSIQETAYALGFRTPAAFSRAFKRWTGMAPKNYRPSR